MKITLLLPVGGGLPVGGVKIVYEYANGLTQRGHQVSVVHPAMLRRDTPLRQRPRYVARYLRRLIERSYRPSSWFAIDSRVRLLWVPSLDPRYIPDGDAIVATAWETAEWLSDYPLAKGRRFYLIQGLEKWEAPEERVLATWRLPFRKIVVGRWLQQIAGSIGEGAEYIPNGLDFEAFGIDVSPEARIPSRVLMLYHEAHWKGAAEGLEALSLAREQVPELDIRLFGVHPAPRLLPYGAQYVRLPSQGQLRRLYNEAAIFVSSSRTEGWGLTPSEALMCGCALAVTDTGGHREFGIHERTALLSPVQDPLELSRNIVRLVRDTELRLSLAREGNAYVQRFTWCSALDAFERLLQSSNESGPGLWTDPVHQAGEPL